MGLPVFKEKWWSLLKIITSKLYNFQYIGNVTIYRKIFHKAAQRANLKFNGSKSVFSTQQLLLLGYIIENGCISPDPEKLRPLLELLLPQKSLNRCLTLFSYYSRWVPNFSDRVKPITSCKSFPLSSEAEIAFEDLKRIIAKAVLFAIDESVPFVVETDASDVAIAATLHKKGRPEDFFSPILQGSELKHSATENKAQIKNGKIMRWRLEQSC